jgi:hypothetical protein
MSVGRISGPLLKANLLRDGVDLAFETNLLYLNVTNSRVGIKTSTPAYDLDVNGSFRSNDMNVTGQATIGPYLTINGNTITSATDALNLTAASGGVVYQGAINTGNIIIEGNTISTINNNNLEVRPNGTGITQIYSNSKVWGDLTVTGTINALSDVTISGNITLANQNAGSINFAAGIASDIIPATTNTYSLGNPTYNWSDVYSNNLYVGNISIKNNTISTISSNSDLSLSGNGTGSVNVENLSINNYTISTTDDITFTPGTGDSVIINSTGAIKIPVGGTMQRPSTSLTGMIRFNTDYNQYEGYDGSYWMPLAGVSSQDWNTLITAETSPGANDGIITFTVNSTQVADMTLARFNVNALTVGNITINNNTITSGIDQDLFVNSSGSGSIYLDNLAIQGSTITNTTADAVTVLSSEGAGYVQIDGSYGFVLPVGTNGNKITDVSNPIGLTRYNTDDQRAEVWDGHEWVSVAGPGAGVVQEDANLIAILTVFSYG